MLVMSGLLYAVHWFLYAAIANTLAENFKLVFKYVYFSLWVLLPVTGWVAESWLGRYQAIVVGLVLSFVTVLTAQAGFVMLQFDWTPILAFILIVVGLLFGTFGIGGLYTIMLPFALDQMIGASAEQLSAVVQWFCWGFDIALLLVHILECAPIPDQLQYMDILPVIYLTLATLCLSAVLIMDCLYHKWLDTNNKTGNPVKLIFKVLNYARKNKCPRLRSALTYIDEEHPSRLDFGKHKFGGPFTEEEVEDVKTIFRLTPVLLSCFGVFVFSEFEVSSLPANNLDHCLSMFDQISFGTLIFVLIPVYRFIVYPLARKHIPSLLKMIGVGLLLSLLSSVITTIVAGVDHFSEQSHNITMPDTPQVSLYWILIVQYLNGIGAVMTFVFAVEFTMAQTPNRMRGIMMGLVIAMAGWTRHTGDFIKLIKVSTQKYLFFCYLVLFPLLILSFAVFLILAKRYKLRERERHVNIQAIVEEHYERYYDQEEEYMREIAATLHSN